MRYASILAILLLVASCALAAWDNDNPADNDYWDVAAGLIRDNWDAIEVELGVDLAEAHPYYQASAPSTKPDGSTALDEDDNGRLWIDSDDNKIYILTDYSGPTWTEQTGSNSYSASDATYTLQNTDQEDTDGGRQVRYIGKGEQSGGEATTLGYIEFSHEGTGDDQAGQFILMLNDGDDGDAPSKQAIGFMSTGKIDVANSLSVLDEDDMSSDDAEVLATQQSIKAYVDSASNFTPATYAGEQSVTFPNGFIIKFGSQATVTTGGTTTTFSTAFPTNCISVVIVDAASGGKADTVNGCNVMSFSAAGFTADTGDAGITKVNWVAFGY